MADCGGSCGSCGVEGCGDRTEPQLTSITNVKNVFCVHSGKGGVGKSLVTGLLASALNRKGYKVAVLDADITGPSAPKLFGIQGPIQGDFNNNMYPVSTKTGIKVMSLNLMFPPDQQDTPVLWRGPVVNGILHQFWENCNWEDIDVMLIDMPPGTSDVSFTMMSDLLNSQLPLPLRGVISVSSPQDLVGMIVGKAVNMASSFKTNVLALVENMAYFTCDECGKKHYIYGEPKGEEIAKRYNIPAWAELPIDPEFARKCDAGEIEDYELGDKLDAVIAAIEEHMVSEEPEPAAE